MQLNTILNNKMQQKMYDNVDLTAAMIFMAFFMFNLKGEIMNVSRKKM